MDFKRRLLVLYCTLSYYNHLSTVVLVRGKRIDFSHT